MDCGKIGLGTLTQRSHVVTNRVMPPLGARFAWVVLPVILGLPVSALAETSASARGDNAPTNQPRIGPPSGPPRRSVTTAAPDAAAKSANGGGKPSTTAQARSDEPSARQRAGAHKKGRPPAHPQPKLPADEERPDSNDAVRRAIAAGPIDEDTSRGPNNPELLALERAEKALFPIALSGMRPGYSWDSVFPPSDLEPPVGPASSPTSETELSELGDKTWLRNLKLPTLSVRFDSKVLTYLEFYRSTRQGRTIIRAWAKKSGRYCKAIEARLAAAGLPADLVWQSMIESGQDPTAYSPAGAAGLWQFMPETARTYGLVVDRWVDERLDPVESTRAAIRLLSDLHRRFGNWELALAAYNMGSAGLARSIRKYNSNDYFALSRYEGALPWETSLYVPKIFALAVVMNNEDAFGIADVDKDDPIQFDTVLVSPGQPLAPVARAAGIGDSELARLNPQLRAGRAPPAPSGRHDSCRLYVPSGTADSVMRRLGKRAGLEADLEPYIVKRGETIETIARRRGTLVENLTRINRLVKTEELDSGTVLLVPKASVQRAAQAQAESDQIVVVPPGALPSDGDRRVFYRVVAGDTLSKIARAFGVTRSELLAWNPIDSSARLQAQMVLQILLRSNTSPGEVAYLDEKRAKLLVAGTPEFAEYFEGLRGNERVVIEARSGDTLSSIGARYGVSAGMMERINQRSRNDALAEGERVVVYVRKGRVPRRDRVSLLPKGAAGAADAPAPVPDALPALSSATPGDGDGARVR